MKENNQITMLQL